MAATRHTGSEAYTVVCVEYRHQWDGCSEALLDAFYQSRDSRMAASVLRHGEFYARVIAGEAVTDEEHVDGQ